MGGLTVRKKGRDTIFFGGRNCRESFSARKGRIACRKPLGNGPFYSTKTDREGSESYFENLSQVTKVNPARAHSSS